MKGNATGDLIFFLKARRIGTLRLELGGSLQQERNFVIETAWKPLHSDMVDATYSPADEFWQVIQLHATTIYMVGLQTLHYGMVEKTNMILSDHNAFPDPTTCAGDLSQFDISPHQHHMQVIQFRFLFT